MGQVISVHLVSAKVRGRAKRYPYHYVRVCLREPGAGHYLRSRGCETLRSMGPYRGTVRALAAAKIWARKKAAELGVGRIEIP